MSGRNTAFLSQERFDEIRSVYSRFNEPWLKEETEELKSMAADGVPVKEMAVQLQRTPQAIKMKLMSLGLYVPKPAPPRWTPEDDLELVKMYSAGSLFEEMQERFGRSENAIVSRLVHLRVNIFANV